MHPDVPLDAKPAAKPSKPIHSVVATLPTLGENAKKRKATADSKKSKAAKVTPKIDKKNTASLKESSNVVDKEDLDDTLEYKAELERQHNTTLSLKRNLSHLDGVDMTEDILSLTGIGITVKALITHDNSAVKNWAKHLVKKWKLVSKKKCYYMPPKMAEASIRA